MDIKHIYENITIDQPAEYQVKVKGNPQLLEKILEIYQSMRVTSESADPDLQICMITIRNTNQEQLFKFIKMLIRFHYPIISIACSNISSKKIEDKRNNDASSIAASA